MGKGPAQAAGNKEVTAQQDGQVSQPLRGDGRFRPAVAEGGERSRASVLQLRLSLGGIFG